MADYLTVDGYLQRYGSQETATVTNEARATPGSPPVVVASRVEEAIADAADVVNSYVGTRYALPLVGVPRIVVGWTAVLAREFLFKNKPLAAVTEAADRVRKQLVDLSTRKLNLPLPEGGGEPAENASGSPQTSGDAPAPTFSASRLDGYMGAFGTGYGVPCWRTGGR